MKVRVRTGGRLHFGFLNLSLSLERLYGGIGVALDRPETVVTATPAERIGAPDELVASLARRSVDLLDVSGVEIEVEESLPRHVGLGSGTQLALSVYTAVAHAHRETPDARRAAPALDRGGRSGVGVATFESGGFVMDAGHPTERFTTDRPEPGSWTVPPVAVRHEVPDEWRFVVVLPDIQSGRSGDDEDESMRSIVERADAEIANEISALLTRRLLPAIAGADHETFGVIAAEIDRLNGVWYADEQGGVYRPPIGEIVNELASNPAIAGTGQSSWGPAIYGVTDSSHVDEATIAAENALETVDETGDILVASGRNSGASVSREAE